MKPDKHFIIPQTYCHTSIIFNLLLPLTSFCSIICHIQSSSLINDNNEECTECNAYKCMEEEAHCGPHGYLIAYGERNCKRFKSADIFDRFDEIGKRFVNCTGDCLIEEMERYIARQKHNIECNELKTAGFASHPKCYLHCGFCRACRTNKWALFRGYRLTDFFSLEAFHQVMIVMRHCGLFSCLFEF